jgi:hypothetical protein
MIGYNEQEVISIAISRKAGQAATSMIAFLCGLCSFA